MFLLSWTQNRFTSTIVIYVYYISFIYYHTTFKSCIILLSIGSIVSIKSRLWICSHLIAIIFLILCILLLVWKVFVTAPDDNLTPYLPSKSCNTTFTFLHIIPLWTIKKLGFPLQHYSWMLPKPCMYLNQTSSKQQRNNARYKRVSSKLQLVTFNFKNPFCHICPNCH